VMCSQQYRNNDGICCTHTTTASSVFLLFSFKFCPVSLLVVYVLVCKTQISKKISKTFTFFC
jgi:hypothetical protein